MAVDALEYQVLSVIRERHRFIRYSRILQTNLFESLQTRYVFELIASFHERHKSDTLTVRSLKILLNSKIKETDRSQYRGVVNRIRKNYVKDNNVVDDIIKRFAKRQHLKHAVLEAVNALDAGEEADLERVREKIDEAIKVDSRNVDDSYNYFNDPNRRIHEETSEFRLSTGLSVEIDRAMGGGLGPGEIGLIVAPTGVGKTLALVNIGYNALLQGKKVIHATLEIRPRKAARRYDVRLTRRSFGELKDDPELLRRKLLNLQRIGAGLHIKDYTSTLCSVLDIRAYIDRISQKGFKPNLLIVDHADLMYTPKQYKERRYELSSIIAGLRRLSSELSIPVWTASQATRKAGEAGRTKLWDIAEDIGKANWADFLITISQNDHEKEEGVAYLNLVKTREDGMNPRVMVNIDYSTMTMKGPSKNGKP